MEAIMTAIPTQLLYTKTHEWVRCDSENTITIGITEHAADALGDIVFVDLPEVGESFSPQQDIAVIESVKTAADVMRLSLEQCLPLTTRSTARPS